MQFAVLAVFAVLLAGCTSVSNSFDEAEAPSLSFTGCTVLSAVSQADFNQRTSIPNWRDSDSPIAKSTTIEIGACEKISFGSLTALNTQYLKVQKAGLIPPESCRNSFPNYPDQLAGLAFENQTIATALESIFPDTTTVEFSIYLDPLDEPSQLTWTVAGTTSSLTRFAIESEDQYESISSPVSIWTDGNKLLRWENSLSGTQTTPFVSFYTGEIQWPAQISGYQETWLGLSSYRIDNSIGTTISSFKNTLCEV